MFIFILWINVCAARPPVPANTEDVLRAAPQMRIDEKHDALPSVALTDQILFQILAAEIALQRKLFAPAYQTYLALARETHDPRMSQRAAEIALYAHSPSDALAAARIWRHDAPDSKRAAHFETKLLVLNGYFDEAQPILAAELANLPDAHRGAEILALQTLIAKYADTRRGLRALQSLLKDEMGRAEAHLALARQQILANQPTDAQRSLERTLTLKPDSEDAAVLLAQFGPEQRQRAIDAMRAAVEQNPTAHKTRLVLVQLLAQTGQIDDARALLARLQSSDPQMQILVARIDSALLLDAQRGTQAEARLAQAYKIWPDVPELIYDYAMAAERNRHYTRMEALLRQLIALQPDEPEAYNALGYSLAIRGQQLNQAKQLIEKAADLAPDNPYILDSLGWVKYQMGDLGKAVIVLRRAYQIEPHAEIGAHLGEVLWNQGRREEAKKIWRDAQRLKPGRETLRETMQRLLGTP